ncbi:MAG: hypothetical protein NVS3B26_02050 [Mycobacteriales bacterium]
MCASRDRPFTVRLPLTADHGRRGWYDRNIPIADDRFDDDQAELAKQTEPAAKQAKVQQKGRTKR